MSVHTWHCGGETRASDTLGQDLQMAVSHHAGWEPNPVLCKSISAFNF